MKKIAEISLLAVFILSSASISGCAQQAKTVHLDVRAEGKAWKVMNIDNKPPSPVVRVTEGEIVSWKSESALAIQFPDNIATIFEPVAPTDSLEYGSMKNVPANTEFKLKVKKGAKKGPIWYAVYVKKAGIFAQGQSPPVIIIY